jgi:outer membrane protein TolC
MKPFYKIFALILILLPGVSLGQETQGGQSFTLEQCVQYALDNSINVKNAAIDEKIADGRVKETRGIGLPQIDGKVQLLHNEQLQRFFNSFEVANGFTGGTLPEFPGVDDSDIVALGSPFQLKNSGDASLAISQILFNGSYLVGLKAASAYRELSEKTTTQTKEQTIQQVTKAYYGVLINKDRMQLFDNNINRIDSLLITTRALNQNGFVESIDVDRIQVALNNLQVERDKFQNLQELSVLLLKFQMNYPMEQPMDVAGDISTLNIDENLLNTYSANWDYKQRSDYQLMETNRKLQALNLRNTYAGSLPSLVAFANLGYSTQSPTISGLFKTNTPIEDMEGGGGSIGPDKWYPYSMMGVTLSVPIFSGLQRTYKVQQAKLALLKVENGFQTLNSAIAMEVKQSAISYQNAIKSLKSQEANRKLASNIARVTKIKYEQGVGSNIEVIDAESSLKEAQINYYNSLYDALVAKVDLDKAYGKLVPPTTTENK